MKLVISIFAAVMMLAWALSGCSAKPSAPDLTVDVKESELLRVSQDDAVAYFNEHADEIQTLAAYLLQHESLFESRPAAISANVAADRIDDASVRAIADALFADGVVQSVWTLNDPVQEARFVIGWKNDAFTQQFLYTSDPAYPSQLADRDGELAVSVTFHTEQDGLLGPITVYFDPATGKPIGVDPRY